MRSRRNGGRREGQSLKPRPIDVGPNLATLREAVHEELQTASVFVRTALALLDVRTVEVALFHGVSDVSFAFGKVVLLDQFTVDQMITDPTRPCTAPCAKKCCGES